jgi:PAS domain S-box-containing protein
MRSLVAGPGGSATGALFPDVAASSREAGTTHLETLYRLTDRLYRASDMQAVFHAAMDAIMEGLGCPKCSILLFDKMGDMRFMAWRELSDTYRRTLDGHTPWKPGTMEPPPVFVNDIEAMDESEHVKAAMRSEGIRSVAFIPVTSQGRVIGKFMAYYPAPHRYSEAARALAVTIARQLGFSIERARAEQLRISDLRDLQDSEQRFRLMAEKAPVMIWMSDAQGNCLHLNEMLRRFWGVGETGSASFDWHATVHPDDADYVSARMCAANERQERVSVVARYRNGTGEYRILETLAHPRFSGDGLFMGLTGIYTDVTEREYAVKALRDSEERFRLVVEAAPCGMVMTDGEGRILMINALCERLFGYERGELLGRSIEVLVPPHLRGQHPAWRSRHTQTPPPHLITREVLGHHKDGRDIPLEIGVNPIQTWEGMRVIATVSDIAERKQAEAQRELLLAELNHRVKNTLSVVQGIAYQTFRHSDGVARRAFEGRLLALARAHDLLTRSHWESTSLRQIAIDTLHIEKPDGQRIAAAGPLINLNPHAALTIALALHELLTNALKYGALSKDTGGVALSWQASENNTKLRIEWREHGGPAIRPPTHRGFGSLLLEHTLARHLDGRVALSFEQTGAMCVIEMPLSEPGGPACLG